MWGFRPTDRRSDGHMDLLGAIWRKSSYSGNGGATCVEVATVTGSAANAERVIAVRDSKDPHGPNLAFPPAQWQAFTAAIKAGEFDLA